MQTIETDLQFCLETLGLNDKQTDEILNCCENLGAIPVEYFCEEFIFGSRENSEELDPEEINRLHDSDYLSIAEFNNLHWRSH